jgi:hypothetical protein
MLIVRVDYFASSKNLHPEEFRATVRKKDRVPLGENLIYQNSREARTFSFEFQASFLTLTVI